MWTMMKQLKNRIIRLLETGSIMDEDERRKLEYLLKTRNGIHIAYVTLQ